jgi:hypothetical protein
MLSAVLNADVSYTLAELARYRIVRPLAAR